MTATTTTQTSISLARDASLFTRILVGVRALVVLKDDQANPFYARLLHLSFDREVYARLADRMRQDPSWRRIMEERRSIPGGRWNFESLAQLPEGTLGHAFTRYYADNGIHPFSYEYPLVDDVEFLAKRYRETHDLHHIVTGYGIDPVGEIEIQAFYFGNLGFRHAAFITFVSMFTSRAGHRWRLIRHVRKLMAAYRRGKATPMILGVPFDELWELPVSEISARHVAPAN
jgi:ubiquinone biosynthesis protein COQ4